MNLLDEIRYGYQRVTRGWSDRDTWGAGEHVLRVTAEMLQRLNDSTYADYDGWFKLNVQEKEMSAYKDLQSVIDDMNNYLDFTKTNWSDGLTPIDTGGGDFMATWVDETTQVPLTEAEVRSRIDAWSKQELDLYQKASGAMQFFSRHFQSFWD